MKRCAAFTFFNALLLITLTVSFAGTAFAGRCAMMEMPSGTAKPGEPPCHEETEKQEVPDCCKNGACLFCLMAPMMQGQELTFRATAPFRQFSDDIVRHAYQSPHYRLMRPPRLFLT